MFENAKTIKLSDELRNRVRDAWQTGHGGSPEDVHILVSDSSIALILPKAMVQAEIVLLNNTSSTRILDQYVRSMLEMIAEDLSPLIEDYSGREIKEIVPLIDLKAGWMTAFYKFKDLAEDDQD
jgi:uncharacterized protein YbcI